MTENQKSLITRLRRTGYGYKAIADAVNVSRDAVKSFCVRNNILHETNIKGAVDIDFCPNCYGALEHIDKHKKKRFCCDSCRIEWWKKHRSETKRNMTRICICKNCGREFRSYPSEKKKFCDRHCYFAYRYGKGGDGCDRERIS